MNSQIDNAIKRARGYWFVDGFTEIAAGGFFIHLAGLLLFGGSASQTSFSSWLLSAAVEISIAKFVGILIAILALWWLKDRYTYPRTGFVRRSRVTSIQVLMIIRNTILFLLLPIFGLLTAFLLMVSADSVLSSMSAWFPVGLSILWAVLFTLAGEWMGLRRFRIMGILILLTGAAIGVWQFTKGLPVFPADFGPGALPGVIVESITRSLESLSLLVLITGIILLISGILTFLRYRKENPQPYAEDV